MVKRHFFPALLIIFLLTNPDIFGSSDSPFQMLRYNKSARASALAGCFEAMPNDPGALFINPATISTVDDKNFSLTFFKHVLDINSGVVSYLHKVEDMGTFAASLNFTNYGSFDYADQYGVRDGTFSGNNASFGISYSDELDENLYYGVTGKFIFMTLDDASSFAFAVDAGIIYLMPDKKTNLGFSILHAGTQLSKFEDYSEELPLDIRLGVNHRLEGLPLLVNLSLHHLGDDVDSFFDRFLNFSIAGELYLSQYVQARLGYDNQIRRETSPASDKEFAGISAGLGITMEDFNFDYAISQVGASAIWHRFGLSLNL